jgi:hypothetical protein
MELDRRDLLMALASGTVFAATPLGTLAASSRQDWAGVLSDLLPHVDSARAVGRAYLDGNPGDFDPQAVVNILFSGQDRVETQRLRRAVAARIRADFAGGRTVALHGWVLSRTEVELCALVAMLAA